MNRIVFTSIWLVLLLCTIDTSAQEYTSSSFSYGFFNNDDTVDLIKVKYRVTSHSSTDPNNDDDDNKMNVDDEDKEGIVTLEVYLKTPQGKARRVVRNFRKIGLADVSVGPGSRVGEFVLTEASTFMHEPATSYHYKYNEKFDDWFLVVDEIYVKMEEGEECDDKHECDGYGKTYYSYYPGTESVDGAKIDKKDALTVEAAEESPIMKRWGELFYVGNELERLYTINPSSLQDKPSFNVLRGIPTDALSPPQGTKCFGFEFKDVLRDIPVNRGNVELYNNIAFYMSFSERDHACAQMILEEVVKNVPDRLHAYLNLADLYASDGSTQKARESYAKYVELMKRAGKEKKIPARNY